jgi:hypothetical protein
MTFPPAGPILIVSPHLDDAALSCGALIERAEPLDVVTIFTGRPMPLQRTEWDRVCGFGDSDAAVAGRLEEERLAFVGTGHRVHRLELLESQYLTAPRADEDRAEIIAWLTGWVDDAGPGATVALPACAGRVYHAMERMVGTPRGSRRAMIKRLAGRPGRALLAWANRRVVLRNTPFVHGDHRTVRDAGLAALGGRDDVDVLLYEEVPYLWGRPADDEVARAASSLGRTPRPVHARVDRAGKAGRVGAYRSQIGHLFTNGHPLDDPAGLPEVERYWYLERDAAAHDRRTQTSSARASGD